MIFFPLKQGVLMHGRVFLQLSKGHSCYSSRKFGNQRHKSVFIRIQDANLSVLNTIIVKTENVEKAISGMMGTIVPCLLGPKRAGRIRKHFILSKVNDVHQYAFRNPLNKEG